MNIEATPAMAALVERRTKAEQRAAALTDALDAVRLDVVNAVCGWRETAEAVARFDRSRMKLAKAGDVFLAAVRTAAAERGVEDWLVGKPYDDSAFFNLTDFINAATSLGPRAHEAAPVDAFRMVSTITTLAND